MKIIIIVGARPNFMKAAPIINAIKVYNDRFKFLLVHTGQHYDEDMSKIFFKDLQLPEPNTYLGIGSGTHAEQTGKIMIELEKCFMKEHPDLVMVVGDVNSTMAAALTAAKLCISVAHIESGLRSFDRTMPEEINRIVTDSITDYLFTTCEEANENLINEGHPEDRIFFVGNVMIDSLLKTKKLSETSTIIEQLGLKENGSVKPYGVLTLHRPSNVDAKKNLQSIFEALKVISKEIPIIFPVHPRTRIKIEEFGLLHYLNTLQFGESNSSNNASSPLDLSNNVHCINPIGYLDFLCLLSNSRLALTDSGGIQEETTIMKIPCLTLRDNTERGITIREGTNILVGNDKDRITTGAYKQFEKDYEDLKAPKYWDGRAAERIVDVLIKIKNTFSHEEHEETLRQETIICDQ